MSISSKNLAAKRAMRFGARAGEGARDEHSATKV